MKDEPPLVFTLSEIATRDGLSVDHRQVLDAVPVSKGATVLQIARTAGVSAAGVEAALDVLVEADLVDVLDGRWRLRPLRGGTERGPTGSG